VIVIPVKKKNNKIILQNKLLSVRTIGSKTVEIFVTKNDKVEDVKIKIKNINPESPDP